MAPHHLATAAGLHVLRLGGFNGLMIVLVVIATRAGSWDLPFGRGQRFGSNMNALLEGIPFERWPAANHYVLQVENFGRTLRDGAAYPCPLEFSKGTQRMIDMVLEAEQRG